MANDNQKIFVSFEDFKFFFFFGIKHIVISLMKSALVTSITSDSLIVNCNINVRMLSTCNCASGDQVNDI